MAAKAYACPNCGGKTEVKLYGEKRPDGTQYIGFICKGTCGRYVGRIVDQVEERADLLDIEVEAMNQHFRGMLCE